MVQIGLVLAALDAAQVRSIDVTSIEITLRSTNLIIETSSIEIDRDTRRGPCKLYV